MNSVSGRSRPVSLITGIYFYIAVNGNNAFFGAEWDLRLQYLEWPLRKKKKRQSSFYKTFMSQSHNHLAMRQQWQPLHHHDVPSDNHLKASG